MAGKRDESLEWGARLIADMPTAVALFDRELRYVAASPAWTKAFRLGGAPLAGQPHNEFCALGQPALRQVQLAALAGDAVDESAIAETVVPSTLAGVRLSARPHHHPDGTIAGVVVALRDAADPAAAGAKRPAQGAPAGLADRTELIASLGDALANPDAAQQPVLVLAISLDNLRGVKNLYGAAFAERVWHTVADRLMSGTRARLMGEEGAPSRWRDLVALLGPEQFGVLCAAPAPAPPDAEGLANRLLRLVQAPISVDGQSVRLGASVGLLTTTASHRKADDVLRDLDVALQQAQLLGPGKSVAWQPALTVAATRQYTLAEQVRRGFENGEFALHYQPIVQLRDGRMVGAEALLRWNHPSDGLVPAAAFFPVLEETGLIVDVGCWVIREAIRRLESWRQLYGRDIVEWLSVNLSARQLDNPVALLSTLRLIHKASFPIHRLRLEISESALHRRPEHSGPLLEELADLGIHLAIDDFAAGPGALESVRRYPVGTVKIDAAPVSRVGSEEGGKIVRALLDFAQAQRIAVIAKSIETEVQCDFLGGNGCSLGQGSLFAEPMDAARFGTYALTNAETAGRVRAPRKAAAPAAGKRLTSPSTGQ
jgi:diguanylate cyclase